MAHPSYGADLIPFCEEQGLSTVRRLRHVDNHFHSLDWVGVDKWLLVKEAELVDESASNSRKAVLIAERANKLATKAMMLSAAIAIIAAVIGVMFAK
jgi:hypothetical protein